jgi:hypothetical protein
VPPQREHKASNPKKIINSVIHIPNDRHQYGRMNDIMDKN